MLESAISDLAISSKSTRVAAAFSYRTVQIWDLTTRALVREFETIFYFGGKRLTLDAGGQKCVTAGWNKGKRGGVACYEADTGKLIWHRQDLRHTQRVRFSATHNGFWSIPGSGRTRLLDSDDGRDIDSIVGLKDLYESEYSTDQLLEKRNRNRNYILQSGKTREIPRLTFAILGAVFGPQSLAISESGGPVRCFDFSGIELWRFTPEQGSHVGALWFREADKNFYGVLCNYEQGSFKCLVRLDSATGDAKILSDLDSREDSYCARLDCIVNSSGAVIDVSEGRILHQLAFPQKEYHGVPISNA